MNADWSWLAPTLVHLAGLWAPLLAIVAIPAWVARDRIREWIA